MRVVLGWEELLTAPARSLPLIRHLCHGLGLRTYWDPGGEVLYLEPPLLGKSLSVTAGSEGSPLERELAREVTAALKVRLVGAGARVVLSEHSRRDAVLRVHAGTHGPAGAVTRYGWGWGNGWGGCREGARLSRLVAEELNREAGLPRLGGGLLLSSPCSRRLLRIRLQRPAGRESAADWAEAVALAIYRGLARFWGEPALGDLGRRIPHWYAEHATREVSAMFRPLPAPVIPLRPRVPEDLSETERTLGHPVPASSDPRTDLEPAGTPQDQQAHPGVVSHSTILPELYALGQHVATSRPVVEPTYRDHREGADPAGGPEVEAVPGVQPDGLAATSPLQDVPASGEHDPKQAVIRPVPVQTESVQAEPDRPGYAQTESVQAEPIRPEYVQTEFVQAEAVQAQSVQADTVDTQSINTQPVNTQPVETQPVDTQSVETQSVDTQSVEAQSIDTQSVEAHPVDAQPVETQPVETQPVDTQSVEAQPVDAQPVETQPVETQPVEAQPVDTQSVEPQPVRTELVPTKSQQPTVSANSPRASQGTTIRAPGPSEALLFTEASALPRKARRFRAPCPLKRHRGPEPLEPRSSQTRLTQSVPEALESPAEAPSPAGSRLAQCFSLPTQPFSSPTPTTQPAEPGPPGLAFTEPRTAGQRPGTRQQSFRTLLPPRKVPLDPRIVPGHGPSYTFRRALAADPGTSPSVDASGSPQQFGWLSRTAVPIRPDEEEPTRSPGPARSVSPAPDLPPAEPSVSPLSDAEPPAPHLPAVEQPAPPPAVITAPKVEPETHQLITTAQVETRAGKAAAAGSLNRPRSRVIQLDGTVIRHS